MLVCYFVDYLLCMMCLFVLADWRVCCWLALFPALVVTCMLLRL